MLPHPVALPHVAVRPLETAIITQGATEDLAAQPERHIDVLLLRCMLIYICITYWYIMVYSMYILYMFIYIPIHYWYMMVYHMYIL